MKKMDLIDLQGQGDIYIFFVDKETLDWVVHDDAAYPIPAHPIPADVLARMDSDTAEHLELNAETRDSNDRAMALLGEKHFCSVHAAINEAVKKGFTIAGSYSGEFY